MTDPVLVACSHGTRVEAGRATVDALRSSIRELRPELEVLPAHVDVHGPTLTEVTAALTAAGRRFVVVPLLLSVGMHVRVDIGTAIAQSAGLGRAAPALGPDPLLLDVLVERLAQAHVPDDAPLVLAAAGSSDPDGVAAVHTAARDLAHRRNSPVQAGFVSAARPTVAEAVAASPAGVAVASYLLAPGRFQATLESAGGTLVTAPLGAHPAIAELVLRRYDEAARD